MALSSVVSVQLGAALATRLFPLVGPVGAVSLRLLGGSVVLLVLTRPWRARWQGRELLASALFGVVLTTMNVCLYFAISRLPLATGITLEYLGPLTLAVATARTWSQRVWALPTAIGVLLLGGTLRVGDSLGVVAALAAATCWAGYIVLSGRLGRSGTGLSGLALANSLGALVVLPAGIVVAGTALWRPSTLLVGLGVGILSSAFPYSLDLLALRRLPTAVFGVLTSLNPAVAALAGLVVLGQDLPATRLAGIALIIAASAGMTLTSRSPA